MITKNILQNKQILTALQPYGSIQNITPLTKALTNKVYKVQCKDNTVVLKIFNTKNKNLFNRSLEHTAYDLLKNKKITPQVLHFNKYNFSILQYIPNVPTQINTNSAKQIAESLHAIHSLNIQGQPQNLQKLFNNKYINIIKQFNSNIDYTKLQNLQNYLQHCFALLKNYPADIALCHNDLNLENLLQDTNNHIWLIDFEYARHNDIYFDLAWLANGFNFDNNFTAFLQHYQTISNKPINKHKLDIYTAMVASFGSLWLLRFNYKQAFEFYYKSATAHFNKIK